MVVSPEDEGQRVLMPPVDDELRAHGEAGLVGGLLHPIWSDADASRMATVYACRLCGLMG
jgi:hypothetical protein